MSFLNRVFHRDKTSKKNAAAPEEVPRQTRWEDGWARTEVAPEEIQELLRGCTHEIKLRGLSSPFLLLPYRPDVDANAGRAFIRTFFNPQNGELTGAYLQQELRLTETDVLCSALKWCWSRLPGGVVTWDVYELFRQGEVDSSMARDSFATFIPISSDSESRSKIIFDYFDLLSAIAANGKHNGLGGLKLSRLAGWWGFEHSDTGFGFEGGYSSWIAAADATCHLFFAYLRSLSPADPSRSVSLLPTSLRALLASVEYPPVTPPQLQTRSIRVALTVDKVAPSPFALLRRAKHHKYDPGNTALRMFTEYEDPVRALSDECKRVLKCISSTGHSSGGIFKNGGTRDESWSRFQDLGFSGLLETDDQHDDTDEDGLPSPTFQRRQLSQQPHSSRSLDIGMDVARPTTPSWADFMDGGFVEGQGNSKPATLFLPSDKMLPPIGGQDRIRSSASNRRMNDGADLEPGELESVTAIDIDDAFWWVWMSSLAGEETSSRKAVFGRCALVETTFKGSKWLVVEEKVRGAAKLEELPHKEKKRRGLKLTTKLRRRSLNNKVESPASKPMKQYNPSLPAVNRSNIAPDQTAKIQAAAAALRQQQEDTEFSHLRQTQARADAPAGRTNSVFTLQPVIMSEASPAMKWANRYDRDALRDAYLTGKPMPAQSQSQSQSQSRSPSMLDLPQKDEQKPVQQTPRSDPQMGPPITPASSAAPSRVESPAPPAPVKKDSPPPPATPKSNHNTISPASPASPATNSGTSIAEKRTSQPDVLQSYATSQKSEKPKVSRLRALFGNGKPEPSSGASLAVPSSGMGMGRSLSMRRKHNPVPQPTAEPIPQPAQPEHTAAPVTKPVKPVQQALPTLTPERRRPSVAQEEEATKVFSTFDQGPLTDQPAFAPDSSPEASTRASTPAPAPAPAPVVTPVRPVTPPQVAPATEPVLPVSPVVQDRWAQIRKNAADRAAKQPKQSEELSRSEARGSEDGETSGEETIESRVARIKARVAELTGNAEQDPHRT